MFLETSEDAPPPSVLTGTLRTFAAMGILRSLSGILLGRPGGHNLSPEQFMHYDNAVKRVVSEEEGLTDLPIATRIDFGHTDPIFVISCGVETVINCESRVFSIDESACTA